MKKDYHNLTGVSSKLIGRITKSASTKWADNEENKGSLALAVASMEEKFSTDEFHELFLLTSPAKLKKNYGLAFIKEKLESFVKLEPVMASVQTEYGLLLTRTEAHPVPQKKRKV